MSPGKNNSNYSITAKLFHWGFVILVIYGVVKQVDDINQLEDNLFFKFEIIFALIFLILLVIRFIYMKTTQKSSLPPETSKTQKFVAKVIQNGMYILMALTVMSGLFIGFLFWLEIKSGILINITVAIHEFIINLLYWFIGIHILAATYHRLKKDGVWTSMVPFFRE